MPVVSQKCDWYYTPNQNLACFVLYLKIINIFLKIMYASVSKLFKEPKNCITIWLGQTVELLKQ